MFYKDTRSVYENENLATGGCGESHRVAVKEALLRLKSRSDG